MPKFVSESITSLVNKLTQIDERFVLPSVQRPYVWKEKQIYKLFDSIMRSYPLGSLLVWKTKKKIVSRELKKDWSKKGQQANGSMPDSKPKNMILDGQQRLQSLLIGLRGTHEGRALYFNAIINPERSPEEREKDDGLMFVFKFYKDAKKIPTGFIQVSDLCEKFIKHKSCNDIAEMYINNSSGNTKIDDKYKKQLITNIETFRHTFVTNHSAIAYNFIDELSDPDESKTDDEIVEIFIRANGGGTKLNKSDLLFSLLSTGWTSAYDEITEIQEVLSSAGFDFSKDYILKALLLCTNQGAAYKVEKFKQQGSLEKVQESWEAVRDSIHDVITFLKECTPINTKKQLVSQNSLLPIISMRKKLGKRQWNILEKNPLAEYMLITTLAGSFNGAKDTLLDKLSDSMKTKFSLQDVMNILRDDNRSVKFDEKKIWKISYANPEKVYFCMSQVIPNARLSEVSRKNIDHIISRDSLSGLRFGEKKIKTEEINQLANLTIIDASQNKSKGAKTLIEWIKEMSPAARLEYLEKNRIPKDEQLWDPQNFKEFIEARKELILKNSDLGNYIASREDIASDEDQIDDEDGDSEE